MEFVEIDGRLILLRNDGRQAWAFGPDWQWRPTTSEFAGRAWVDGKRMTKEQAASRYHCDTGDLPE